MIWIRNGAFALSCICLLVAPGIVHAQNSPAPNSTAPGNPSASATAPATAPAAQAAQESIPVFKATTRLVLVDVVVTDHHGQFIPGLKPANFTVLEDGKPQKVSAFAVHVAPATPKHANPPLKLPPHQYANFTSVAQESDRPVTIVLLDMMNTSGVEQQYARKQMIKFLETLPEGRPVALFTLTSQLKMVQGFTGDSATLVQAAKAVLAKSSLLLGSESQMQDDSITARTLETVAASPSMGPTGGEGTGTGSAPIAPIGQALRYAIDSEDTFQKLQRMQLTIEALNVLARAVAGYSGRKNLLWLSAEFPITFGPDMNPYNQASQAINTGITPEAQTNHQLHNLEYETPPLEETAALLSAAQVAVYPINVSGIINPGTGIDISTQTANLSNLDLMNETQNDNLRQTNAKWDIHESMADVARQTGGEAFYGTNDLKEALQRGMEEGANYYTLAYNPTNSDWSGKYRKIEVKTAASGANLTYRRGYYALPTRPYTGDREAAAMTVAMKFSVPEFTMLFLKVQELPPDADHKTVRIDYAVDAHDVTFTDTADKRKHASVDFVATAWDKDLKLVTHKAETMETNIRLEAFPEVMRTGLPYHQELDLKPGTYLLRMGVLDRGSQKIGTVDVPLTVGDVPGAAAKATP
jgi:VWFA-related protein